MTDVGEIGSDLTAGAAAPAAVTEQPSARLPGQLDALGEYRTIEARRAETETARRAEMDPLIDRTAAAMREPVRKPTPGKMVGPPPQQKFGEDMQGFLQSAMILGAIGGAMGRKHVTNGLTAFAGAIEGFKEGNLQQGKLAMEQWKAATDATLENNKTMMENYNAILKSRKLDLDQKMNEVQLVASKFHDRAAYDAASAKNITELAKYLEQLNYHHEQMQLKRDGLWLQTAKLRQMAEWHEGGKMDPELIDFMAKQALKGDKSVFTNLGRGAQGPQNILAVRTRMQEVAKEQGIAPEKLAEINQTFAAQSAGLRTAFTQEAKMGTAAEEALSTFPLAREAMANLWRSGFVPMNRLIQGFQRGTGSPEEAQAYVAATGAANAYAAVMGRGNTVLTEGARAKAESLLNTAMSPAAFNAALDQMEKEMTVVMRAPAGSRERLLGKKEPPAGPEVTGAPKEGDTAFGPDNVTLTRRGGVWVDEIGKRVWSKGQWQPIQ